MIVTSVTPEGKRKCKVFLSEGFAFVLYRGELENYGIEEGGELEERTCRRIVEEVLMIRAKDRALYLLQSQSRPKAQMEKKLTEDGYPAEVVGRVMDFLEEYRFLDDRAYAEHYVSVNGSRKSRRQMVYELRQRGIGQEDIDCVLQETPADDEQSARALLEKRLKGRNTASYEEKCRISAYLGRKGYSFDVIQRVMRDISWEREKDI